MISLKNLRYFVVLVDNGTQSKAAEHLYVTRQTISSAIREIEMDLGKELFIPGSSPLQLTPFGQYLYERSMVLLQEFDRFVYEARNYTNQRFSLYLNSNILGFLPQVKKHILDYLRQYPDIMVETSESENQNSIFDSVMSGTTSCGLMLKLSEYCNDNCWSVPLLSMPVYAILSEEHTLAGCTELSCSQLLEYPLVCFGRPDKFYRPLFEAQHLNGKQALFINEPQAMRASRYMMNNHSAIMLTIPIDNWLPSYPHLKMVPVQGLSWTIELTGLKSQDPEELCRNFALFLKHSLQRP